MAKILLIDDDPFILDIYALKFKERGFEVEIAQNGKDGLKKAKEQMPEIILLDIVMPGMDGFEVLRDLKRDQNTSKIKVIILTNIGQKEEIERGRTLGADDYIIKAHFAPSEVVEKVNSILQK